MNAFQQMVLYSVLGMLALGGIIYVVPKASTKTLNQNIVQTAGFVSTLRDEATDYASINATQDFQSISMDTLNTKGILAGGMAVNGTGSTSYINPPYEQKQKITIFDPNAGSSTDAGKSYEITIDASGSNLTANNKQVWEDKLNAQFQLSGGVVSDYQSSGADGKISVTFQ